MHCGQETGLVNENKGKTYSIRVSCETIKSYNIPKNVPASDEINISENLLFTGAKIEAKYLFALEFLEGLFGKQSGKGNPAPTSSKYASLGKYAHLKQIRPVQANTSILRNTTLIHCTDTATQNYWNLAFHKIQINDDNQQEFK